jgi:hypothetical protein
MKTWIDPVKDQPARPTTMAVKGDFAEFTSLMRRVVTKETKQPTPASASPAPASQKAIR